MGLVEIIPELDDCFIQCRFTDRNGGRNTTGSCQPLGHVLRLGSDIGRVFPPVGGDLVQQCAESRSTPAVFWGEVGACEKRVLVWGQEYSHGPASLAVIHGYCGLHVDFVQIGPFFSIDLDTHKVVVHQFGDGLVLERFPFHDMAPVAGGIADREQDGTILLLRECQRLRPPGVPIYRVVGMLA